MPVAQVAGAPPPPPAPPQAAAAPPPGQAPGPLIPPLFAGTPSPVTPQLIAARQLGKDAFALRLVAFILDAFMVGVIAYLLSPLWSGLGPLGALIGWWSGAVLMAVYMIVMEGSSGQTVGKMLMNVKVVREDLGAISIKEAQSRAMGVLLYPLLIPILLDLIYVSDEGQSLGDRWAKTTVIKVQ